MVFGDRSTIRSTFGCEFEARHCNQWGLYGVRVRQRRDAALFPNYFEQTSLVLVWCRDARQLGSLCISSRFTTVKAECGIFYWVGAVS